MNIKDESELAHVLGMAFAHHANQLQNHRMLQPYRAFIKGEDSVVVTVTLHDGGLTVEEGPDVNVFKAEIKHLEGKVKDQAKEIKSLNLVLEQSLKKEETEEKTDWKPDSEITMNISKVGIDKKLKTKKRRQKQK